MRTRYDRARDALYALAPRGIVLGLDPMRDALHAFGDPHMRLACAHVAGTNGKGSTAAMVERGLRASGVRTGLYTSPHLSRFVERIRIDGEPCDEALATRCIERVLEAIERGRVPRLTFFEAATLVAWLAFTDARVERVVLEVGLGGRLDATNVCAPAVTAISSIGLDHQAMLGPTLEAIGREKAGIAKPGVPLIVGPTLARGPVREAIEAIAHARGAPVHDAPRLSYTALDDGAALVRDELGRQGRLGLRGAHQVDNAAVALGVLRRWGVDDAHAFEGFATVQWPGRLERVTDRVWLDVAHNPDGARVLFDALASQRPRPSVLVFGASRDKDWRAMLDTLSPLTAENARYFCAAGLARAEDPATLAAHGGARGSHTCGSVVEALERALRAHRDEGVLVCGSVFVVGEARAHLRGERADPPVGL